MINQSQRISEHEALQQIKSYIENNKKSRRNDAFQKGFMFLGNYILQIIEDTDT